MRGGSRPNAGRKTKRATKHVAFTKARRKRFLQALQEHPNATLACASVCIARQTAYKRRHADPDFAKEWDAALDIGVDKLEEEAKRRAMGYDEDVFYQGERVGAVKRYSDNLLMFTIKRYRPEYRDNFNVNLQGDMNHRHTLGNDPRETAKWLAFMLARGMPPDPRLAEVKQLPKLGPAEEWHKKADVPLEPATTETEPAQNSGESIEAYRGDAGEHR